MKRVDKINLIDISARYLFLLLIGFPNLFLFYFVFAPLTIYPLYFLLKIFFDVSISGNFINIGNIFSVQIIDSCVAGAAYYLLLVLNLSTPKIKARQRIKMILYSFASLLILNIFRIFILILMINSNFTFFELTHKIFWYLLSIIFVVGIWFIQVRIYRIEKVPFYSDIIYAYHKLIG